MISWPLETFAVMGKCSSQSETQTYITPLINRWSLVLFAQLQKDALCSEEGQAAKSVEERKSRVIKPLRRESRFLELELFFDSICPRRFWQITNSLAISNRLHAEDWPHSFPVLSVWIIPVGLSSVWVLLNSVHFIFLSKNFSYLSGKVWIALEVYLKYHNSENSENSREYWTLALESPIVTCQEFENTKKLCWCINCITADDYV